MVLHSKCPDARIPRTLTHRNAQVPALRRTRCAVTALTAQVLRGAKLLHTCTHVFRTNAPGMNHNITACRMNYPIYHDTHQPSPTCLPIFPKRGGKESWQAASGAGQKVIFPANPHTCSNISFLRLTEGCGFRAVRNRISTP